MQIFATYSIKFKIKSSIVNVGSIVGENGFTELAGYSSTKGAINSLTKSFAVEFAKKILEQMWLIQDSSNLHILINLKK